MRSTLAVLLFVGPQLASASVQVLEDDLPVPWAVCVDCEIRLSVERRLSSTLSDPFALVKGDAARLAFTPSGAIWLAPRTVVHALARFNEQGELVQFVDREGDGPAEYRFIRDIDTHGGQLTVLAGTRVSRHDWLEGSLIDSRQIEISPFRFLSLPNGNVVVNGSAVGGGRLGPVLHVVDSLGTVRRSFGPRTAGVSFDRVNSTITLGAAPDGAFWSGRINRYLLEKYSSRGELLRTIERDVDWFRPWDTFVDVGRGQPHPQVGGLMEDPGGRLWVLVWVGDDQHDPAREYSGAGDVQAPEDLTWDSIIEVLDAATGEVLASRRLSQYVVGFVNGRLVGFDVAEDGGQELVVMVPTLSR